MTHPAALIVTGIVIFAAAVIAVFASTANERPQSHRGGRSSYGERKARPSPPPTPPPSSFVSRREKRRKSPPRSSYNPGNSPTENVHSAREATEKQCTNCGESQRLKVYPCQHESLCKLCVDDHLESNDTCPDCYRRIDSISPPIKPFGKCVNCRKFRKLFKFLPCNDSLSLCISCFESLGKSYKECPKCGNAISGSEPKYDSSGKCGVCHHFTRFAKFYPCGHGNFCKKDAEAYLAYDNECVDCGEQVIRFK